MKKKKLIILILGLSLGLVSCDENITRIKNFLPTHWVIMGIERNGFNITRNIDLNALSFDSKGECHVPRILDGKLLIGDGTWKVEKVNIVSYLILLIVL